VRNPKPIVQPKAILAMERSFLVTSRGLKLGERSVSIMELRKTVEEALWIGLSSG
jgi:hypothetical protein